MRRQIAELEAESAQTKIEDETRAIPDVRMPNELCNSNVFPLPAFPMIAADGYWRCTGIASPDLASLQNALQIRKRRKFIVNPRVLRQMDQIWRQVGTRVKRQIIKLRQ